jgi:ADP-ribose pyrophosphatase YjhB (NUDIX family)
MDDPLVGLTPDEVRARPGLERLAEVAVGAIVLGRDGDEVLVLRREATADDPAFEKLPSAAVEPGETLGEAVRRVARTQAGLEARGIGDLWFGLSHVTERGTAVEFAYVVDAGPGPVATGPPAGWSHRWVPRHDLMVSDLLPTAAEALTKRLGGTRPP